MLRGSLEETGQAEEEFAPQLIYLADLVSQLKLRKLNLLLASDQSSYVTGTIIHADAGYTSR